MTKCFRLFYGILFLLLIIHLGNGQPSVSSAPESQDFSPETLKELADIISDYVESDSVVGAELLVLKNKEVILHEVFGWHDREEQKAMQRNTVFNLRSMSKPVVSAVVQILIDEGKLKISDPVSLYLAGFKNSRSESITIEHLLTHRSGLPLTLTTTAKELAKYKSIIELANAAGEKGPEFEPGSKFWYSDTGTEVLGAIVETVSGVSLDSFIEERIFQPLGMKDTFHFTQKTPRPSDRIASIYFGGAGDWRKFWTSGNSSFYPIVLASQSIYSTPRDYARFMAMLMDKGRSADGPVLTPEAVSRMLTPVSRMSTMGDDAPMPTGFPGYKVYYGQMVSLYIHEEAQDKKTADIIGHSGSDGTIVWAWPDQDLVILYFTQSRGQLTALRLETEIDRLLIHPESEEVAVPIPDELKPYLGKYMVKDAPQETPLYEVLYQNDNLAVDVPGQLVFDMNGPDEQGAWTFKLANTITVTFRKDESGKVRDMIIAQLVKLPQKTRLEEGIEYVPEEYRPFLGIYTIPFQNREISFFFENDQFKVKAPNGKISVYDGPENGIWTNPINGNRIFFETDSQGKVLLNLIVNTFFSKVDDTE